MRRALTIFAAVALAFAWHPAHADGGTDAGDLDAGENDAAPVEATAPPSDAATVPGEATDFQVLTGFSSKESCSCVFVDGLTDDYCTTFGQFQGFPNIALAFDHTGNVASATFLGVTRTAHFVAGEGCKLDPPQ